MCIACFVCAFSFVACMSSCASRTRLAHANVQCVSIAPHIFIYAIRFSIFCRDCLFLCLVYGEYARARLSFSRKGKGKGKENRRREGQAVKDSRWQASFIDRVRRSLYITLPPFYASRVEINGVTFCNYTPSGSMPTSHSNRSGVPATRLKIYDFKVSVTLQII